MNRSSKEKRRTIDVYTQFMFSQNWKLKSLFAPSGKDLENLMLAILNVFFLMIFHSWKMLKKNTTHSEAYFVTKESKYFMWTVGCESLTSQNSRTSSSKIQQEANDRGRQTKYDPWCFRSIEDNQVVEKTMEGFKLNSRNSWKAKDWQKTLNLTIHCYRPMTNLYLRDPFTTIVMQYHWTHVRRYVTVKLCMGKYIFKIPPCLRWKSSDCLQPWKILTLSGGDELVLSKMWRLVSHNVLMYINQKIVGKHLQKKERWLQESIGLRV